MGAEEQHPSPSQDAASVMRGMSTEELTCACEQGSQAACAELDRRGVEPASVPPDPVIRADNVIELDAVRDRTLDATRLRELAGTLRAEADSFEQDAATFALIFAEAEPDTHRERESLRHAVLCTVTAASLQSSADCLGRLAEALLTPEPVGERKGENCTCRSCALEAGREA